MLSIPGKIFTRQHFEEFSYFSQKIGFDILCKLSPNLHEISKPIFFGNIRKVSVCCLLTFPRRVVMIKYW